MEKLLAWQKRRGTIFWQKIPILLYHISIIAGQLFGMRLSMASPNLLDKSKTSSRELSFKQEDRLMFT